MEAALLHHRFGKGAYTVPTVYVAVYSVAPTGAGGGTELTGGSWARKLTAASDWGTAAGGSPSTLSNAAAITFAALPAGPVTAVAFATFDALTAGNMLDYGLLTTAVQIATGQQLQFPVGSLTFSEE